MAHEIVMIPIEALVHHPDNPRKELGDLRELVASIKESGVMQNLTVVPNPKDEETWLVVIGNRRLEASKAAGIRELPCVISDMDYKEQLATMMAENMQRVDLTVMEQAQGVQLMMDLGMDAAEISKKTGLRKDAIQRRVLMMQYDAGKVKQAIAKGGTISDFAELEKIRDAKQREKLLMDIGTPNFRNHLRGALDDQKDWDSIYALVKKLEAFATRIEKAGEVNGRQQKMLDVQRWHRMNAREAAESYKPPKDVKERRYYYLVDTYPAVTLMVAVDSATEIDSLEQQKKARQEKLKEAHEARHVWVKEICDRHRELRFDFLRNGAGLKLDREYLVGQLMDLSLRVSGYVSGKVEARLCDLLEVDHIGKWSDVWWRDLLQRRTAYTAACIVAVKLDNGYANFFRSEWSSNNHTTVVVHHKDPNLIRLYEVLQHIGYEMSDEEKAMMDGTHEVFGKVVATSD